MTKYSMYINRPSDSFTFYAEGPDDGSFDSTESRDGNRFFGMADSLAEAEEARREFHDANFMVSVLNQQ